MECDGDVHFTSVSDITDIESFVKDNDFDLVISDAAEIIDIDAHGRLVTKLLSVVKNTGAIIMRNSVLRFSSRYNEITD